MAEVRAEQILELVPIEFADMERIAVARHVRVLVLVRARDDQRAAGAQNPLHLAQHRLVLAVVFDRLEADDHVYRLVGQGDGDAVADGELQVRVLVAASRMRDRVRRDVGADHAGRDPGQQSAAVAFTAGDVEHTASAAILAGEKIPVQVLEPDIARDLRYKSLTRPRELVRVVRVLAHAR